VDRAIRAVRRGTRGSWRTRRRLLVRRFSVRVGTTVPAGPAARAAGSTGPARPGSRRPRAARAPPRTASRLSTPAPRSRSGTPAATGRSGPGTPPPCTHSPAGHPRRRKPRPARPSRPPAGTAPPGTTRPPSPRSAGAACDSRFSSRCTSSRTSITGQDIDHSADPSRGMTEPAPNSPGRPAHRTPARRSVPPHQVPPRHRRAAPSGRCPPDRPTPRPNPGRWPQPTPIAASFSVTRRRDHRDHRTGIVCQPPDERRAPDGSRPHYGMVKLRYIQVKRWPALAAGSADPVPAVAFVHAWCARLEAVCASASAQGPG